jgi:hypothetical protein
MKKLLAATLLSAALASPAVAGGVKVGVLTCQVDGGVGWIVGSSKDVDCVFDRTGPGGKERYVGTHWKAWSRHWRDARHRHGLDRFCARQNQEGLFEGQLHRCVRGSHRWFGSRCQCSGRWLQKVDQLATH